MGRQCAFRRDEICCCDHLQLRWMVGEWLEGRGSICVACTYTGTRLCSDGIILCRLRLLKRMMERALPLSCLPAFVCQRYSNASQWWLSLGGSEVREKQNRVAIKMWQELLARSKGWHWMGPPNQTTRAVVWDHVGEGLLGERLASWAGFLGVAHAKAIFYPSGWLPLPT